MFRLPVSDGAGQKAGVRGELKLVFMRVVIEGGAGYCDDVDLPGSPRMGEDREGAYAISRASGAKDASESSDILRVIDVTGTWGGNDGAASAFGAQLLGGVPPFVFSELKSS